MLERILKTLEEKLLIDRYYMEKEQVKDLEKQIKFVENEIAKKETLEKERRK